MVDSYCVSERDTVLPVVPMFHANAWGYPYACVMNGANMVLPGRDLSPNNISRLLVEENITLAAGLLVK
jgi:fatty-acyl-CoA synthase